VPLALALEEAGFSRATPELGLLASPPPANGMKYILITGDRGLSPNNSAEVAMATARSNSSGADVKVVVISMAGSEGLDFKFIRQVHVVDPWYNMNRIEQIIGRAVRLCSHKDLPLDERNVMIFLHVSRLEDANMEAADVYVYRVAEGKAVSIGRVSRVLKQNSVDCLLTSQDMSSLEGQIIRQSLSNGETIEHKLGDVPFSAACDYMETCSYNCTPKREIKPDDVTLDTYAESFILANSDRLVTRIRQLFKENHFYSKKRLVAEINANRSYPVMQIDAALQRLVTGGNEFVTDVYGRMGRVHNVGDLYLFIPLELRGEATSLYDRRVPLDYKRRALKFTPTKGAVGVEESAETLTSADNDVYERLTALVNVTMGAGPSEGELPEGGGWFKDARKTLGIMEKAGFGKKSAMQSVVAHAIEMLTLQDTLALLNGLGKGDAGDPVSSYVHEYFDKHTIVKGSRSFLLLLDKHAPVVAKRVGSKWEAGGPEATRAIAPELKHLRDEYLPMPVKCGPTLGFMGAWKGDYTIFKVKDTRLARNKGARCDQSAKSVLMRRIAEIGETRFAEDDRLGRVGLCCVLEIVLRHLDNTRRDNLRWFAPPGLAVLLIESKSSS
jgi:hypothetical protein